MDGPGDVGFYLRGRGVVRCVMAMDESFRGRVRLKDPGELARASGDMVDVPVWVLACLRRSYFPPYFCDDARLADAALPRLGGFQLRSLTCSSWAESTQQ